MVPLSSEPGVGRVLIPSREKHGHPKWQRGATHALVSQVWSVDSQVLLAHLHSDCSRRGQRNSVETTCLQLVVDQVAKWLDPGVLGNESGRAQ